MVASLIFLEVLLNINYIPRSHRQWSSIYQGKRGGEIYIGVKGVTYVVMEGTLVMGAEHTMHYM